MVSSSAVRLLPRYCRSGPPTTAFCSPWPTLVGNQKNSPRRRDAGGFDGESRDAPGGGSSDRGLSPFSSVASLPIHSIEPMHELLKRLVLELANSLARQAQVLTDFTKGHGRERFEAKPHPDHRGLAVLKLVQAAEDTVEVVGLDHQILGGLAPVVGQHVIEYLALILAALGLRHQVVDLDGLGHDANLL